MPSLSIVNSHEQLNKNFFNLWSHVSLSKQLHIHLFLTGSASLYRSGIVDVDAKLLKRKFIAFTTSGSQSPYDDLTDDLNGVDDMNDIDEMNAINGNNSLKGNSHISSVQSEGKPGLTSFSDTDEAGDDIQVSGSGSEPSNIIWFIGPTVLVASLVFPSFYLRRILLTIFEDSLFTGTLLLLI